MAIKRTLVLGGKNSDIHIEIQARFISHNGLTIWEVNNKAADLEDELYEVLKQRFHIRHITTKRRAAVTKFV